MSAREIEDGAAQAAIQSAMARLAVLARVYDRLRLRSEGEAVVSANEFITGLGSDLEPALIGLRPIALTVRAEPIPLELGRAVPVGLIVNEALTNAIKYGFPEDAAGHVAVLFEERDGRLHLEVSDNGIGMTAEQRGRGVGTRLIRALAQQLGGTPDWHGPPGTTLVVQFPKHASDGAPFEPPAP
jgi:two-component system, sensor histidine kinase PdtaS